MTSVEETEENEKEEKKSFWEIIRFNIKQNGSLMIGLIGLGIAISVFITTWISGNENLKLQLLKTSMGLSETDRELSIIKEKINDLSSIRSSTKANDLSSIEIKKLSLRIDSIDKDLEKINNLFISDSERSVSLPLLKKEIETIKNENELLKQQINEYNLQFRWLLGTMFLSIIALFFNNWKSNKK